MPLTISRDEIDDLLMLSRSRTAPAGKVERARILLAHARGVPIAQIARELNTDRSKIYRCIKKAQTFGVKESLDDLERTLRKSTITEAAKTWLLEIAGKNPQDFGYASPRWTQELLAEHARDHCQRVGHPSLRNLQKSTVNKILGEKGIKPNRAGLYLDRRGQQDASVHEVLCVYQHLELLTAPASMGSRQPVVLSSCDSGADIHLVSNNCGNSTVATASQINDDFVRSGISNLLAGIDLKNGYVHGLISSRSRSKEFVNLLKQVHAYYPRDTRIRIILHEQNEHTSPEAEKYLAKFTNRFEIVSNSKWPSWHKFVNTFFRVKAAEQL